MGITENDVLNILYKNNRGMNPAEIFVNLRAMSGISPQEGINGTALVYGILLSLLEVGLVVRASRKENNATSFLPASARDIAKIKLDKRGKV